MARTRTSTRASQPQPQPTQSPQASSLQRTPLARRTKPLDLHLDESDDSANDDSDDSDVSLESEADLSDDEVDMGIDRHIRDIDIPQEQPHTAKGKKRHSRFRKAAQNVASASKSASQTRRRGRPRAQKDTPRRQKSDPSTPWSVKRKRMETHALRPPSKRTKATQESQPTTGTILSKVKPNWLSPAIPYSAWVDIFYYAATAGGTLDNSWLLHAATTCKAFADPALTTLYQCPSPSSTIKAKKLVTLLSTPREEILFDYATKVEFVYINLDKFPSALLPQFVQLLRRLKELVIFTPLDQPPYRDLDKTIRWHYPEELFRALDNSAELVGPETQSPIRLKSWEWSSRLLGGHVADFNSISAIHQQPSFAHLRKLGFTNFQVPSLKKAEARPDDEEGAAQLREEDGRAIDAIAHSISQLSSLRHLTFESSTKVTERLLPQLPKDLLHFELINCWEIRSDDLASFLQTHGRSLRSLTLNHNQSLDLAFLTDLAVHCPNLRELHMNLSYYRHHESLDDADPNYDEALLPTQLPLWPSTLRVLEIEHVRQWSVEAAEMFLQSLIDSAPNLPDLRYLAIKSMLNIPWQRRAELRRSWREKLEKVFLRSDSPPSHHVTLRKQEEEQPVVEKSKKKSAPREPSRRSGRVDAKNNSDSDRSSRLRSRSQQGRPMYRDPDTDEDEVSDDDGDEEKEEKFSEDEQSTEEKGNDQEAQLPVQAMCHTVSILFDNQKVRELQYGMEDFGDDESQSSGEEWNEDGEDDEDAVYAW